jgi:hypothetical protein
MPIPTKEKEWSDRAKRFLKAELKRSNMTYEELAKRLKKYGLDETTASVSNKLSRGTFPATFFLAAMAAMGLEDFRMENL